VGILRGAVLGRKGKEGRGLGNSGIFRRRCEGRGIRAEVRAEGESIRAEVEISYSYFKIGNKSINNIYNGCNIFCAVSWNFHKIYFILSASVGRAAHDSVRSASYA
jgi:hypothetical protein